LVGETADAKGRNVFNRSMTRGIKWVTRGHDALKRRERKYAFWMKRGCRNAGGMRLKGIVKERWKKGSYKGGT